MITGFSTSLHRCNVLDANGNLFHVSSLHSSSCTSYGERFCAPRYGLLQQSPFDKQAIERRSRYATLMCSSPSRTDVLQGSALPELHPLSDDYETAHAFTSFANWIVPGKVLLGRYPYVEPSRCRTHDQGEAQMQQIMEQGVTIFISLQAETPPQTEMTMGGVMGFVPYAAVAALLNSAMAGPPDMKEVNGLRNQYLDSYLPPRRKQERDAQPRQTRPKLSFLHFPIVDLSIPSTQLVEDLTEEIAWRMKTGEKLYVHCWGGRGRAGTIGACLLHRLYGVDADEALERVQRAFITRGDGTYASPETQQQVDFVRQYIASHK